VPNKPFLLRAAHVLLHFSSQKPPSLLKRDGAARQREEWHLDIFQAKAVNVYGVPQEKLEIVDTKRMVSLHPFQKFGSS
jgi:hypothetical protein